MPRMTISTAFLVSVSLIATTPIASRAGDLNPPSGVVTPTMKSLQEVEPRVPLSQATTPGDADSVFKITQPGSYYLTGNLVGQSGKHGIEIATVAVTLDLNGFFLEGKPGTLDGVTVTGVSQPDIVIRNGTIESWREDGVDATNTVGVRVEELSVTLCVGTGVRVGLSGNVSNCTVSICAAGFASGNSCNFDRCTATQSTAGSGFGLGEACVVTRCTSTGNSSVGIFTGAGSTVSDCTAASNTNTGISISQGGVATRCAARSNGASGISGSASQIIECTASLNATYGITVGGSSAVIGCLCYDNNTAGIRTSGTQNRIDGNTCKSNGVGYDIATHSNLVTRNWAILNTTAYSIVANNDAATIQTSPVGAGPWDNFQ